MTIKELIGRLEQFPLDREVMILDSFNGGGCPREINLKPMSRRITKANGNDSADCEDLVGKNVVVMGYGCY